MNFKLSKQTIYLLTLSFILLIFVLIFSLFVLIPSGKEYRILRADMKKEYKKLDDVKSWYDMTFQNLKEYQDKNRNVISAFSNRFIAQRFVNEHKKSFEALKLSRLERIEDEKGFEVYEVNATSKIDTPKTFYTFIEDVSKSSWIVGIDFPIKFVKQGSLIHSNFTMRVYKDVNSSQTVEKASSSM